MSEDYCIFRKKGYVVVPVEYMQTLNKLRLSINFCGMPTVMGLKVEQLSFSIKYELII